MQGERVEANETERLIILKQRGAAPFIGSAKVKMAESLAVIRAYKLSAMYLPSGGGPATVIQIDRVRLDNASGRTAVIGEMRHSGDLSRPTLGLYRKIRNSVRLHAGNILAPLLFCFLSRY